tara:strand:+ start:413 stop:637 length:225 start_codon:yes stop_codon:yes gene_type:complete
MKVSNTKDFTEGLREYCMGHIYDFAGMPMDYEFNGVVYDMDDYLEYLTDYDARLFSCLMLQADRRTQSLYEIES